MFPQQFKDKAKSKEGLGEHQTVSFTHIEVMERFIFAAFVL